MAAMFGCEIPTTSFHLLGEAAPEVGRLRQLGTHELDGDRPVELGVDGRRDQRVGAGGDRSGDLVALADDAALQALALRPGG